MVLVFVVTVICIAAGCPGQVRTQLDYCETSSHPLQV